MRTTQRQLRTHKPSLDDMRYDLAEKEAGDLYGHDLIQVVLHGMVGLKSCSEAEIRKEWEEAFGDTKQNNKTNQ